MNSHVSRRTVLVSAGLLALAGRSSAAAGRSAGQGSSVLRLIANENPYGPSPAAQDAATGAVADSWKYAMRETAALKKLIAEQAGATPKHVMVCAGSTEALRVSALLFGRDGGQVVASKPTFSFLPDYARALGCRVTEVPLDVNMCHDLDAMASALQSDARVIYVCNPNNPTGTRVDGAPLRAFIESVSPRVPVVVDEAYLDLSEDLPAHTAVPRVLAGDPVIVTRTFSKLHGMAGMRVGYALAPPALIERLETLRISQMSYPGVLAAAASLQDTEFQAFSRTQIRKGLRITEDALTELDRPWVPSYGNFIYFDTGAPARQFMRAMRKAGILTGLGFAPYTNWARVSMGKVDQMRQFAAALRAHFSSE